MRVLPVAAPLPLEGRGWGSIIGPHNHPLSDPPLKGEGAKEPQGRGSAEADPRALGSSPTVPEGGAEFGFGIRAKLRGC